MSYRFRRKEAVADGVRRIAREEMFKAIEAAKDEKRPIVDRIHDARTSCKKLRGLLRIVRPRLGDVYRQENAFFRDTARTLSAARDATIVVALFDDVVDTIEIDRDAAERLRSQIEQSAESSDDSGGAIALASVAASLGEHLPCVEDWPIEPPGFRAIRGGLKDTYRSGRETMWRAFRTSDAVDWHQWRKQVKYHLYHIRLLRNVWKPVMAVRRNELDRLADLLGTDHDLTVLAETITTFGTDDAVRPLLERIDDRRTAIRIAARPLGERIFAERPKAFAKRLRRYGKVWQSD